MALLIASVSRVVPSPVAPKARTLKGAGAAPGAGAWARAGTAARQRAREAGSRRRAMGDGMFRAMMGVVGIGRTGADATPDAPGGQRMLAASGRRPSGKPKALLFNPKPRGGPPRRRGRPRR